MENELITTLLEQLDEDIGAVYEVEPLPIENGTEMFDERWSFRLLIHVGDDCLDILSRFKNFLLSDRRGKFTLDNIAVRVSIDNLDCDVDGIYALINADINTKVALYADMKSAGQHISLLYQAYVDRFLSLPDLRFNPSFIQDMNALSEKAGSTCDALSLAFPSVRFFVNDDKDKPDSEGIIFHAVTFRLCTGWRIKLKQQTLTSLKLKQLGYSTITRDTETLDPLAVKTNLDSTLMMLKIQLSPMSDQDMIEATARATEIAQSQGGSAAKKAKAAEDTVWATLASQRLNPSPEDSWAVFLSGRLWISTLSNEDEVVSLMRRFFTDTLTVMHEVFTTPMIEAEIEPVMNTTNILIPHQLIQVVSSDKIAPATFLTSTALRAAGPDNKVLNVPSDGASAVVH